MECAHGHSFEGWFASEDDFLAQRQNLQVLCPACGDPSVVKKLSAPRLHPNTVNVGNKFCEEARKIHYGEQPKGGIRGPATPEEATNLIEEGIDVLPFPLPAAFREPIQ